MLFISMKILQEEIIDNLKKITLKLEERFSLDSDGMFLLSEVKVKDKIVLRIKCGFVKDNPKKFIISFCSEAQHISSTSRQFYVGRTHKSFESFARVLNKFLDRLAVIEEILRISINMYEISKRDSPDILYFRITKEYILMHSMYNFLIFAYFSNPKSPVEIKDDRISRRKISLAQFLELNSMEKIKEFRSKASK